MAYVEMNHKNANKFKMVQLNRTYEFNQIQKENSEYIVPCQLYVDKRNGVIYFIEQEQGEVLDAIIYDSCINDSIGMRIGDIIS